MATGISTVSVVPSLDPLRVPLREDSDDAQVITDRDAALPDVTLTWGPNDPTSVKTDEAAQTVIQVSQQPGCCRRCCAECGRFSSGPYGKVILPVTILGIIAIVGYVLWRYTDL